MFNKPLNVINQGSGGAGVDLSKHTPILRIDKTLTVAANAFTYTLGDDGKPINAKVLLIDVLVPAGCSAANSVIAYLYAQFNGVSSGYYEYGFSSGIARSGMAVAYAGNVRGFGQARIVMHGNLAQSVAEVGYSDGSNNNKAQASFLSPSLGKDAIDAIYLFVVGGYTLPAGTTIKIWEVAA